MFFKLCSNCSTVFLFLLISKFQFLWHREIIEKFYNTGNPTHILANWKWVMVKLIQLHVFYDLVSELLPKPGNIKWICPIILDAGKYGNRNLVGDVVEIKLRNSVRAVMRLVLFLTSIIVLFEDTSLNNLTVVNQLFNRSGALWKCVQQVPTSLVLVWRLLRKPVVNNVANFFQDFFLANFLQLFHFFWISEFVDTHSFHNIDNYFPILGSFLKCQGWVVVQIYNWCQCNESSKSIFNFDILFVSLTFGKSRKHLGCALRVSNVS